jgi:hypothetical protein
MDDLVEVFRNMMGDDGHATMPSMSDVNLVYGCVPAGNKLRCLLRDCFMCSDAEEPRVGSSETIPSVVLLDVLRAIENEKDTDEDDDEAFGERSVPYNRWDKCFYHQHDAANPECKKDDEDDEDDEDDDHAGMAEEAALYFGSQY